MYIVENRGGDVAVLNIREQQLLECRPSTLVFQVDGERALARMNERRARIATLATGSFAGLQPEVEAIEWEFDYNALVNTLGQLMVHGLEDHFDIPHQSVPHPLDLE